MYNLLPERNAEKINIAIFYTKKCLRKKKCPYKTIINSLFAQNEQFLT